MKVKFTYITPNGNKKTTTSEFGETELWRCVEAFSAAFPHTVIAAIAVNPEEAENAYYEEKEDD